MITFERAPARNTANLKWEVGARVLVARLPAVRVTLSLRTNLWPASSIPIANRLSAFFFFSHSNGQVDTHRELCRIVVHTYCGGHGPESRANRNIEIDRSDEGIYVCYKTIPCNIH